MRYQDWVVLGSRLVKAGEKEAALDVFRSHNEDVCGLLLALFATLIDDRYSVLMMKGDAFRRYVADTTGVKTSYIINQQKPEVLQ